MNKKILSKTQPKTWSLLTYTLLISLLLTMNSTVFAEQNIEQVEQKVEQKGSEQEKSEQDVQEGEAKPKPDNDKVDPLENVDIQIIKRGNKTVTTYSVNGIVYKVKVQPKNAPAYYFYDRDGDGSLETRSDHELNNISVQQWKIFEW